MEVKGWSTFQVLTLHQNCVREDSQCKGDSGQVEAGAADDRWKQVR